MKVDNLIKVKLLLLIRCNKTKEKFYFVCLCQSQASAYFTVKGVHLKKNMSLEFIYDAVLPKCSPVTSYLLMD